MCVCVCMFVCVSARTKMVHSISCSDTFLMKSYNVTLRSLIPRDRQIVLDAQTENRGGRVE